MITSCFDEEVRYFISHDSPSIIEENVEVSVPYLEA